MRDFDRIRRHQHYPFVNQETTSQSKAALPWWEVRISRSMLNSYSRRHRTERTIVSSTNAIDAIRIGTPTNGNVTQNHAPMTAINQEIHATIEHTFGRRLQNQLTRASSSSSNV